MPSIRAELDLAQLERLSATLRQVGKNLTDSLSPAINETLTQVATSSKNPRSISTQIRERINIKKKDVDQHIRLRRASKGSPIGEITLSESERIPLKHFSAKQFAFGVRYKIEKAGGFKRLPSAFGPDIQRLGGHVFKRTGVKQVMTRGRYKGKVREVIAKKYGPSPWGVFVKAGLTDETQEDATEKLRNNLERRVNFIVLKATGQI